jgi:hypothetical protein
LHFSNNRVLLNYNSLRNKRVGLWLLHLKLRKGLYLREAFSLSGFLSKSELLLLQHIYHHALILYKLLLLLRHPRILDKKPGHRFWIVLKILLKVLLIELLLALRIWLEKAGLLYGNRVVHFLV